MPVARFFDFHAPQQALRSDLSSATSCIWTRMFAIFALAIWGGYAAAVELTEAEMQSLRAADIVILGEVHDNPAHHAGQGALMRLVGAKAVVFEMMSPEMAQKANDMGAGDLPALGRAMQWSEWGWPDIATYAPVFEALAGAEVVGAALPPAEMRRGFREGAAVVFGDDAARFGLTEALSAERQEQREQLQFESHCEAMPLEVMPGMVQAQRLMDAQFARAALVAKERFGGPVVVITGYGHARKDWGMPEAIARAAPDVRVFSMAFVEAPHALPDARFDAVVVTDAAERGDPCAALRK